MPSAAAIAANAFGISNAGVTHWRTMLKPSATTTTAITATSRRTLDLLIGSNRFGYERRAPTESERRTAPKGRTVDAVSMANEALYVRAPRVAQIAQPGLNSAYLRGSWFRRTARRCA